MCLQVCTFYRESMCMRECEGKERESVYVYVSTYVCLYFYLSIFYLLHTPLTANKIVKWRGSNFLLGSKTCKGSTKGLRPLKRWETRPGRESWRK